MNILTIPVVCVLSLAGAVAATAETNDMERVATNMTEATDAVQPAAPATSDEAPIPAVEQTDAVETNLPPVQPLEVEKPAEETVTEEPVFRKAPKSAKSPAHSRDIFISGMYSLPLGEGWEGGIGAEARVIWWTSPPWGFGAAIGLASWSFSEDPVDVGPAEATPLAADGDALMLPITALAAWRNTLDNKLELTVEAGLRYVVVDSEVNVSAAYVDHLGRAVSYDSYVDNVNHLMGVAGVSLQGPLDKRWTWRVGLEYQMDIGSPDANWLNQDVANEFDALHLQLGLRTPW